jgi:RNA polymerase sigma-70 factor, ECF subfamily
MDEHLVAQAKRGSREALAQLLHANYEIVFKYLIKFTLNVGMAEDLAQETMVRAIEKLNLYLPERSKFSTWLITIAQNLYIDHLRKRKREQRQIDEEITSESLELIFHEQDDTWKSILDALAELPEEIRLPILLKHYYGYSLEEISKRMSIPLGTVKSRIHNGIKNLRKELEKNEGF